MNAKNFFAELKRRNVYKVATAYAVIAWLLIQVALIPAFEAPSWTIKTLVVFLVLGFAVVVFISWTLRSNPGRDETYGGPLAQRGPSDVES